MIAAAIIVGAAVPTTGSTAGVFSYDLDFITSTARLGKAKVRFTLIEYEGATTGVDSASLDDSGSEEFGGGVGCVVLQRGSRFDGGCAYLKPTSYTRDDFMDESKVSFSGRLLSKVRFAASFTFTSTTPAATSPQPFVEIDPDSITDGAEAGTQITRQRTGKLTGTLSAGSYWGKGSLKPGNGLLTRATIVGAGIQP